MTYELECGHCGYLFTLEEGSRTRSVKCSVCGGVLTVAIAVAKTPEPPPAAPVPTSPPAAKPVPARPEPTELDPEARAARVAEPWKTVRKGLNTARTATDFAFPPYLCFLVLGLLLLPSVPQADERGIVRLMWITAIAHLLPAAIHIAGQIKCTAAPETHGARLVRVSLWVQGIGLLVLLRWDAPLGGTVPIVVCGAHFIASFVLWLAFLSRLADQFDDRALREEVEWYNSWFGRGVVLALLLLLFAVIIRGGKAPAFAWLGFAGMGTIGILLLGWYSALLRVAMQAIDRHAAVDSAS